MARTISRGRELITFRSNRDCHMFNDDIHDGKSRRHSEVERDPFFQLHPRMTLICVEKQMQLDHLYYLYYSTYFGVFSRCLGSNYNGVLCRSPSNGRWGGAPASVPNCCDRCYGSAPSEPYFQRPHWIMPPATTFADHRHDVQTCYRNVHRCRRCRSGLRTAWSGLAWPSQGLFSWPSTRPNWKAFRIRGYPMPTLG